LDIGTGGEKITRTFLSQYPDPNLQADKLTSSPQVQRYLPLHSE